MTTATVPSPFSWAPSQHWEGFDGLWSSFDLRVGTPTQNVRVLISTAGQATWVISPLFCPNLESGSPNCNQDVGGTFNGNKSQSWAAKNWGGLALETNLYPDEIGGSWGFDSVSLGISNSTKGPRLSNQVLASIIHPTYWFYMGMFGIGREPTNFTTLDHPYPSFLSTLRTENFIPSLSWSYTAGARYRLKGVFGSLIFGGYDRSRFIPNNVSFHLAPDISRDLVVGLQSITATDSSGFNTSLLSSPILTFIDSTIPYIYLPLEVCHAFEKTFGLIWDQGRHLYLIDDKNHEKLLKLNPTFKFRIGDMKQSKITVDIVLPYASFDLVANPPLVDSPSTRYFPLQRAANESQYTLGRTFLQESYIIMNYEHNNFSVFQSRFDDGLQEDIISIPPKQSAESSATTISSFPPTNSGYNSSSRRPIVHVPIVPSLTGSATALLSPSAIASSPTSKHTSSSTPAAQSPSSSSATRVVTAGIVFGTVAFLVVGFLFVAFLVQRWRYPLSESERVGSGIVDEALMKPEGSTHQNVFSLQEIATRSVCEMPDSGRVELQGEEMPIDFGRESSDLGQIDDDVIFRSSSHQSLTKIFMRSGSRATRRFAVYLPTEGILGSWVRQYRPRVPQNNLLVQTSLSQSRLPKSLDLGRPLPSSPLRNSRRIRRKSF